MARRENGKPNAGLRGLRVSGLDSWVTAEEAAVSLGIGVEEALGWMESGRMPGVLIYGGVMHGRRVVRLSTLYGLMTPLGVGC